MIRVYNYFWTSKIYKLVIMEIYDWLRDYFLYPEDIHPTGLDHFKNKAGFLPCGKGIQIPELNLWGVADYFQPEKRLTQISITIWDRKLISESMTRAQEPFGLPDCNYSLYGMYLNMLAYVTGHNFYRLTIVHNPAERKSHEVKYRPDIAAFALNCRRIQIDAEKSKAQEEESAQEETSGNTAKAEQAFHSLF
jgi:hypothetical protein